MRLLILLGIMLIATSAMAQFNSNGNSLDTPKDTEVTAEAADNTIGYEDVDSNPLPTVEVTGGDIAYATLGEYGFSGLFQVSNQYVTPGDLVTNESYYVTNEGNADDTYIIWSYIEYLAGASNWTVEVYDETAGTIVSTLSGTGSQSVYSPTVVDNGDIYYNYRVSVPSNASEAPNNSQVNIYTTVETTSDPAGTQYTGGNDLQYGGDDYKQMPQSEGMALFNKVQAPSMGMTREGIVDSPTLSTYSGGAHDPVPGSVITYSIYYYNGGDATAEGVVLIDKVSTVESPSGADSAGARLAHVNAEGARGVINLTPVNGTGQGWTAYYTTEATLATERTTYEAPGWVSIGLVNSAAYPSSNFYTPSDAQYNARWIKWEKAAVDPHEEESLVWGVSIR